jgi:Mg2+ and Co2+ transporter CorA
VGGGEQEAGRERIREWVSARQDEIADRLWRWPSLTAFAKDPPHWLPPADSDDLWKSAGLPGRPPREAGFWPAGAEPSWAAVATIRGKGGESGILLVDASDGDATSPPRPQDLVEIEKSLAEVKGFVSAAAAADWLGGAYDDAARLAFLYYLRERAGVPAWLWVLDFDGDAAQVATRLGLPADHALDEFVRTEDAAAAIRDVPGRPVVPQRDREAARRVAKDLHQATGLRTWRRVNSLLGEFGIVELAPGARTRAAAALHDAGIEVDPPLDKVQRGDSVRLSAARAGVATATRLTPARASSPSPAEVVRASVWPPRGAPRSARLGELRGQDGVWWLDVDTANADEAALWDELSPLLSGLTRASLGELFSTDEQPRVAVHGRDGPHAVTAAEVVARDASGGGGKTGQLELQVVTFVAGDGWLLSAWHERQVLRGSNPEPIFPKPPPQGYDAVYERAAARWDEQPLRTAPDLGILLLRRLSASYTRAVRELYAWLDLWDAEFYARGADIERDTLSDLRNLVTTFRAQLTAFQQPDVPSDRAWLPSTTTRADAEAIDANVARAINELRNLSDRLRGAFDLLTTAALERQLQIAGEQQRAAVQAELRSARFQDAATWFASIVLAPTLIATIFGANPEIYKGEKEWGAAVMAVLMLASAALSFWWLRRWRR